MGTAAELLGRASERDHLEAAVEAARTGAGTLLAFEGPAGIGKTRLLVEGRDLARARDVAVLWATCGELERSEPFGVARRLLGDAVDDERTDVDEAIAAYVRATVALAERGPVLLCVDDAHWADELSLTWLVALARDLHRLPLSLIVTRRAPELDGSAPVLEELTRSALARRVVLGPLGIEETAAITRAVVAQADDALCSTCHETTGGNPFLLRELLAAIGSAGLAPAAAAVTRVEAVGLETIAGWLLARLRRMPEGALSFAQATAVLARGARLRHARVLSGLTDEIADAVRDALVAGGVLTPDDAMDFTHPVLRSAVYGAIPPAVRARLHRDAAALLHQEQVAADRVASHLLRIPGRNDTWVVDRLREAATAARRRGAPEAAVVYLERAADEAPSAALFPAVLEELAAAQWRAAAPAAAVGALERALAFPLERDRQRALALRLTRYLLWENRHLDALVALDRHAPAPADAAEAATAAAEAVAIAIAGAPGVLSERVRALREAAGNAATPAARAVLAYLDAGAGRPAAEVAEAAERVLAETLERPDVSRTPLWPYAVVPLVLAERFELLDRFLGRCTVEAEERGSVPDAIAAACWQAFCDFRRGRLHSAEALCTHALREARRARSGAFVPATLGIAVETAMALGRDADSIGALLAQVPDGPPSSSFVLSYPLYARGRWRISAGEVEAGLRDLERTGEVTARNLMDNPSWTPWRSESARALVRLERFDEARRRCEEELEVARAFGAPRAIGIALRGVATTYAAAERVDLLVEATEHLAGAGAQLDLADALVDLGIALRQARRRRDARQPLRLALDIAQRCGAGPTAARAAIEVEATGAKPRSAYVRGVESLTASERRVAGLAARGSSNRDIAGLLFISIKTVEKHLASAYRKLDVTGRGELAEALLDGGNAPDGS